MLLATCASIPARPRGTKRDGGKNDRTDGGGCPKKPLPKTTGDLDDVDEELDDGDIGDLDDDDKELDDGDIEDDEGLEDEGKIVPVMLAGPPPPPSGRKTLDGRSRRTSSCGARLGTKRSSTSERREA